jgi:AraC-like DNA-binding protein
MKPRLHKLPQYAGSSFNIIESGTYHSYNEWHYHLEIELIYIQSGEGTRFIGDKIEPILNGDLVMIGANIPHMFRFDTHAYQDAMMQQGKVELTKQLITLHFDTEIFGRRFLNLPENETLNDLLKVAARGIIFSGKTQDEAVGLMKRILGSPNHERILLLMQLLNLLAFSKELRYVTSPKYNISFNEQDETRLTKIYLYTLNNFTRNIKLKDVAAIVYMVPNAFCRYFKSRTQKSYFTFLLEVRVSHACKLLAQHDYSMIIVSFESGFTNISNFNRHFKLITGKTPLEYRKEFTSRTS